MRHGSEFEKYAVKHLGLSSNTLNSYEKYLVTGLTPNIIEERPMNVAVMDVYSRLMMDRIIFLGYPINDEVANIITAQLLFLDSTDRHRDIQMYINSPGGSVYSGLGVYDTMQYVTPDVATICIGMAASMGATHASHGSPRMVTPGLREAWNAQRNGFTAVRDTNTTSRSLTIEHHRMAPTSRIPIDLSSALPRLLPLAVDWAERQSAPIRETDVGLDSAVIEDDAI